MFEKIDLKTWKRKDQYDLFKTYEDPFFNLTANVDVTNLIKYCKENKESFFINSIYIGARVNNEIEEFRTRIRGDEVIIHNKVNLGAPILHKNNTFTFCYFNYLDSQLLFKKEAEKSIESELRNPVFNPRHDEDDLIHFSILPWVNFSSLKHPRRIPITDSIPKIVYGKYFKQNSRYFMPISLEAHHALIDGYHAGMFFDKWQEIENEFDNLGL
jgi:chloramphenicol O-acetyltransferase type A